MSNTTAHFMRNLADQVNISTVPQAVLDVIEVASTKGHYNCNINVKASEQGSIVCGLRALGYLVCGYDDEDLNNTLTVHWGVYNEQV